MVEINGQRLLDGLRTLRTFGAFETGVVRPTFSDVDMESRRWLQTEMNEAGLTAEIDGAGNVVGRSPNPGPALVIGSHSDTQPTGGWLDGALGVMYGIEVARALLEDPETQGLAVDAVAWSDEEGTYTSCLGSTSFVGQLTDDKLADANAAGETIAQALERVGLAGRPRVELEKERHVGYLEAHIEQGPHLEDGGLRIGVVTSIVGIRSMIVSFVGQQNHAGTTPMPRRRDAGVALFDFAVRIRERLMAVADPTTVWTIGDARLEPGAQSIIPGYAELVLQFRDPDDALLATMEAEIVELAAAMSQEGPVNVTTKRGREPILPTEMKAEFRAHLGAAADQRAKDGWIEMPSAAGHDPMVIAHELACGMIFIPSIGGVSHDFAEDSHDDDIVLGCQVLADAAVRILEAEIGNVSD